MNMKDFITNNLVVIIMFSLCVIMFILLEYNIVNDYGWIDNMDKYDMRKFGNPSIITTYQKTKYFYIPLVSSIPAILGMIYLKVIKK